MPITPVLDFSRYALPPNDELKLQALRSLSNTFAGIRQEDMARREAEARRMEQEKDRQILRDRMSLMQQQQDVENRRQQEIDALNAAKYRAELVGGVAKQVPDLGYDSAGTILRAGGLGVAPEYELGPMAVPASPETQLSAPPTELTTPVTPKPTIMPGQLAGPKPEDAIMAPPIVMPPTRLSALQVSYGGKDYGRVQAPTKRPWEDLAKDLQTLYVTTLRNSGLPLSQEEIDDVGNMSLEALRITNGNEKEARLWLDQVMKSKLALMKRDKEGEGTGIVGATKASDVIAKMPRLQRNDLERSTKWILDQHKKISTGITESKNLTKSLDHALSLKDPGAQKAAIWEIATLWNGKRLTDADVSRIYEFSDAWSRISSQINQWFAIGKDGLGTLSPDLINQLKAAVNVMRERLNNSENKLQDMTYSRVKEWPAFQAAFQQSPDALEDYAVTLSRFHGEGLPAPINKATDSYDRLDEKKKSYVKSQREKYGKP